MRFFSIILVLITCSHISAQTKYDVRKTQWGCSPEEVKNAELPITHAFEIDSNFISQKQANKVITFKNVVVQKQMAQIDYYFRNNQLVSISFTILNQQDSVFPELYSKITHIQGVYNHLAQDKKLKTVYCWTYDNGSFKQLSGKTACTFADKNTADEMEVYCKDLTYINRAMYVLGNDRTLASFEFDLKSNNPEVLCWINFTVSPKVEQTLKSNDF